jgi:hypothetical protein
MAMKSYGRIARVVVKGDKFKVARAMADAEIPFAFVEQAGVNTVGDVGKQHIPRLSKFLNAHPELEGRYAGHSQQVAANAKRNPVRATATIATGDAVAAQELYLFAVNESELYRQRIVPVINNLRKKVKKGIYRADLALKLWRYVADDAAKRYTHGMYGHGPGYGIFTVPIREAAARELAAHYESEVMRKNPDVHIDIGSHNVKDGKYKWSEGIRNPRKRRRSAAQRAATRKLLAFNRKRRGAGARHGGKRRIRARRGGGKFYDLPVRLLEKRGGNWRTVAAFQGTPRGIKQAKTYARKYANFERVPVKLIRS